MEHPVTQKETNANPLPHKALRLIDQRPRLFAQQGAVVATWRKYKDRRLGPYWRLVYREGGRQRTVYLGRFGPLVRQVRARLRNLQAYRDMRRAIDRSIRAAKAALRDARRDLARHLRRWGLHLAGYEVRGWRSSAIGWAMKLVRPFECVPLGPQPYFPLIRLPSLTQWDRLARARLPAATYWGLSQAKQKHNTKESNQPQNTAPVRTT